MTGTMPPNNAVQFVAAAMGNIDFVVASAVSGYLTPEGANVTDGNTYAYIARTSDGAWEFGSGTYSVSSHTLHRTVISASSAGDTGAPVDFALIPTVTVFPSITKFLELAAVQYIAQTLTTAQQQQVQTNIGRPGLVEIDFYSSSGTITIPPLATRAKVTLWGGTSGGFGGYSGAPNNLEPCGNGAAALLKYLTGLTPGETLTLTVGAAGAGGAGGGGGPTGSAGGDSTLASGTQTIATLTAHGATAPDTGQTGATATGGDINLSGAISAGEAPGMTPLIGTPGGFGGINTTAGAPGIAGGCMIEWYT